MSVEDARLVLLRVLLGAPVVFRFLLAVALAWGITALARRGFSRLNKLTGCVFI
jgi:hypothetical protein